MGSTPPDPDNPQHNDDRRSAELVRSLGAIRARIAAACTAAGRDAGEVTLVAVTKTYPARDITTLARLGVLDIGESKDQEARAKIAELAELPRPPEGVRWHLIGRLQSNKARSVAGYASAVHSLDRRKLVRALADAAGERRTDPLDVFVQVSLDGDPERGGAAIGDVAALAEAVATRPELRLLGVMAVPPIGADPRAAFATLQEVAAGLRAEHPTAVHISAGMSEDLEAAVEHGSTYVRVGSALLGRREPVFG